MRLIDLMTVEEGAAVLGCSVATVWRRIKDGTLTTHHKWGRTFLLHGDVARLKSERSAGRVQVVVDARAEG